MKAERNRIKISLLDTMFHRNIPHYTLQPIHFIFLFYIHAITSPVPFHSVQFSSTTARLWLLMSESSLYPGTPNCLVTFTLEGVTQFGVPG